MSAFLTYAELMINVSVTYADHAGADCDEGGCHTVTYSISIYKKKNADVSHKFGVSFE